MVHDESLAAPAAVGEAAATAPTDWRQLWLKRDLLFGVLLPFVCWRLNAWGTDESIDYGRPSLLALNLGGPVATVLWLATMMLAMGLRVAFTPASALLAGVLGACSVWAWLYAVMLVPLGLFSMFFSPFGLLCFAPICSGIVCWRASRLSFAGAQQQRGPRVDMGLVIGAAMATALAVGGGFQVESYGRGLVERVEVGSSTGKTLERLAFVRPLLMAAGRDPVHDIALRWVEAATPAAKASLAQAYTRLCGARVEDSPEANPVSSD